MVVVQLLIATNLVSIFWVWVTGQNILIATPTSQVIWMKSPHSQMKHMNTIMATIVTKILVIIIQARGQLTFSLIMTYSLWNGSTDPWFSTGSSSSSTNTSILFPFSNIHTFVFDSNNASDPDHARLNHPDGIWNYTLTPGKSASIKLSEAYYWRLILNPNLIRFRIRFKT